MGGYTVTDPARKLSEDIRIQSEACRSCDMVPPAVSGEWAARAAGLEQRLAEAEAHAAQVVNFSCPEEQRSGGCPFEVCAVEKRNVGRKANCWTKVGENTGEAVGKAERDDLRVQAARYEAVRKRFLMIGAADGDGGTADMYTPEETDAFCDALLTAQAATPPVLTAPRRWDRTKYAAQAEASAEGSKP